jgi:hypothetical protein
MYSLRTNYVRLDSIAWILATNFASSTMRWRLASAALSTSDSWSDGPFLVCQYLFFFSAFLTVSFLHSPTGQMSQNAFRFSARASTSSIMRTVPRLAAGANLAFALLLRPVMVSLYYVAIRFFRERRTLTLVYRSDVVCRAGCLDFGDMALDWGEGGGPRFMGAVSAVPGYAGCLGIVDRFVGRGGRSWTNSMVCGIDLVGYADIVDSVELLRVGRSVQDQPDFMGVDSTALWPRWIPCSSSLTGFVPACKVSQYVSRRAVALTSNLIQFAHYYSTYRSFHWVLYFARAFLSFAKQILEWKLCSSSVDHPHHSLVATHWHSHHRI